jgi:hypothetical protein
LSHSVLGVADRRGELANTPLACALRLTSVFFRPPSLTSSLFSPSPPVRLSRKCTPLAVTAIGVRLRRSQAPPPPPQVTKRSPASALVVSRPLQPTCGCSQLRRPPRDQLPLPPQILGLAHMAVRNWRCKDAPITPTAPRCSKIGPLIHSTTTLARNQLRLTRRPPSQTRLACHGADFRTGGRCGAAWAASRAYSSAAAPAFEAVVVISLLAVLLQVAVVDRPRGRLPLLR